MSDKASETSDTKPEIKTAPPTPEWPLVIPLTKPINANGEEIDKISFREPTAGDIDRLGNPVNLDFMGADNPKVTFDAKVMTNMMSHLSATPPSGLKQMTTRDWNTCAWSLARFFMPEM